VYVGDIAEANALALDRGGGIYNLGTGVSTSVNTLFDTLRGLTGFSKGCKHGPALSGEVFKIVLTSERARNELGWSPATRLDAGLRLTVESLANRTGP